MIAEVDWVLKPRDQRVQEVVRGTRLLNEIFHQRQHLVCRRMSEQHLSKDQIEGSRLKCSLPHEQRTSNTGTNVRPYGVSEYRTRRGKPCS
jgi:hypothetical protein